MTTLNIVFAGTPAFGLPCLARLKTSSHTIKAIYTQPDRAAGRGRQLQASPVKQWAIENNIPVHQPLNFKAESTLETLRALQPDVMLVIAYGLILPRKILSIPRYGCINVHASLLPRWRGASPIQQAILHGDPLSGVTIMQMDAGMDTGAILATQTCTITSTDTAQSLHDTLAQLAVDPLLAVLNQLNETTPPRCAQSLEGITYAPKIQKEDALIDWTLPAQTIDYHIRAFNPWPIAYTLLGKEVVRIFQAAYWAIDHHATPGRVLQLDRHGLIIAAGQHAIKITQLQFPGGKVISIADCLNTPKGHALCSGFDGAK